MKTINCFVLIILLVCGAVAQNATKSSQATTLEMTVRDFYRWYIHDSSNVHKNPPWMTTQGRVTMSKYVTQRFIREIVRNEKLPEGEGFDADYFFQTQDPLPSAPKDEPRWIKSMSVSGFNITGASATAIVTFLDGYPKVRVTMITDGKGWKIDRVKNVR